MSGCSAPPLLAHVDDLHRRQRPAVDARGQPHAAQRVDALRPRRRAARDEQRAGLLARGGRRRGARRSAGRPRACRRRRAPRRRRSARAARSARRRPSAARRRRARCRRAGGSTRRGARRRESLECSTATVSPKRSTKRLTICGVSAISGTSTMTPRSLRERRRGGAQVDLGLARARDAVQQQRPRRRRRRSAAVHRRLDLGERERLVGGQRGLRAARADALVVDVAARRAAARARRGRGPRGGAARQVARRPRAAARRAAPAGARSAGAPAAGPAVDRLRPPRELRARARRRRDERERAGRRRAVLLGHPERELDELGGQVVVEHAARRGEPLVGQLRVLGDADDDADDVAVAERDDEHRADADAVRAQVVERPAQGTGRRDRLDLRDRRHRPRMAHVAARAGGGVLAPPARAPAYHRGSWRSSELPTVAGSAARHVEQIVRGRRADRRGAARRRRGARERAHRRGRARRRSCACGRPTRRPPRCAPPPRPARETPTAEVAAASVDEAESPRRPATRPRPPRGGARQGRQGGPRAHLRGARRDARGAARRRDAERPPARAVGLAARQRRAPAARHPRRPRRDDRAAGPRRPRPRRAGRPTRPRARIAAAAPPSSSSTPTSRSSSPAAGADAVSVRHTN